MTEQEGCRLLRRRFEAAGLEVVEGHRLELDGQVVVLDGFDPARGIGYEYVTTEAGDRDEVTPEVIDALERRARDGALFVLLIDERDVDDRSVLERAAEGFLGRLAALGKLP